MLAAETSLSLFGSQSLESALDWMSALQDQHDKVMQAVQKMLHIVATRNRADRIQIFKIVLAACQRSTSGHKYLRKLLVELLDSVDALLDFAIETDGVNWLILVPLIFGGIVRFAIIGAGFNRGFHHGVLIRDL